MAQAAEKLATEETLRVYVGTQVDQMLATKVLEWSIRKHATIPVEIIPIFQALKDKGMEIPVPQSMRKGYTPFSFQRFAIPALMDYKGRAVYVDSDMVVFKDIRELAELPFGDNDLLSIKQPEFTGRPDQFSVMVLNCDALTWNVAEMIEGMDQGKWSYGDIMHKMIHAKSVSKTVPDRWNELERHTPGSTALTHYTDVRTQPWFNAHNVNGKYWFEVLFEAIEAGHISKEFIVDQVRRAYLRPSIIYQLEHNIVDPTTLPKSVIRKDLLTYSFPLKIKGRALQWVGYGNPEPSLAQRMFRVIHALRCNIGYLLGTRKYNKPKKAKV